MSTCTCIICDNRVYAPTQDVGISAPRAIQFCSESCSLAWEYQPDLARWETIWGCSTRASGMREILAATTPDVIGPTAYRIAAALDEPECACPVGYWTKKKNHRANCGIWRLTFEDVDVREVTA